RMGARYGVRVSGAAAAAGSTRQYVWSLYRMGRLAGQHIGREIVLELPPVIAWVRDRGREVRAAWIVAAGEAPAPAPSGPTAEAPPIDAAIDAVARSLASALGELERAKRVLGAGGGR